MGLLSSHYLVTLSLAMSRRQPSPCRAAGPFLEGQSRRSQGGTHLPRDTVSFQQQFLSSLHPAPTLVLQGLVQSGDGEIMVELCPLSPAGTRGQEETVAQREEPVCSRMTQILGVWCPKDRVTASLRVPCSYLKRSQTQKGKSFSEKPPGVSFEGAKELSWASRWEGREGRNSQFPLSEKECDREMNVLGKVLLRLADPGASLGSATLSLCDLGHIPSPL